MLRFLNSINWPIVSGILAAVILAQAMGLLPNATIGSQRIHPKEPATAAVNSYQNAVSQAAPSVVNIYTRRHERSRAPRIFRDPFFQQFFRKSTPPIQERMKETLGSGVIMTAEGYVLTNNHVIAGADEILVLLYDGTQSKASIIGVDPETDLAVLKIANTDGTPIQIGDPNSVNVGDVVLAIGNPFGVGQTVTQGIISATGRYGLGLNTFEDFIQTDAAINPGNSGGALVNHQGHLIGINTAILDSESGWSGISFAIPANTAIQVMSDLVQYGRVIRGWLGLEAQQLTPQIATSFGLDRNKKGIIVTGVYRNSPAHKAGFKAGDIITAIDNVPIVDGRSGMNRVAASKPGDSIAIDIIRQGKATRLSATLSNRPSQ